MKTCSQCKIKKPIDAFFNYHRSKDGKTAACKRCTLEKQKERYLNNKTEISLKQKEYYKQNKEKVKQPKINIKKGVKLNKPFQPSLPGI